MLFARTWGKLGDTHGYEKILSILLILALIFIVPQAWVFGILIFLIGIPSALSFGILSDIHILGMSIFDFADFLTSSFGLPLGALFISLFAGYVLTKSELQNDLKVNQFLLNTWRFIVRFAAPIAIIIVFIQGVMKLFV